MALSDIRLFSNVVEKGSGQPIETLNVIYKIERKNKTSIRYRISTGIRIISYNSGNGKRNKEEREKAENLVVINIKMDQF